MQTLIELYDENPIENVLGTEMFRPKTTVLLCPQDEASGMKASLEKYFRYRKCNVRLVIVPVSLVDTSKVEKRLREVLEQFDDCTIDISGGTDAALFAAGAVGGDTSGGKTLFLRYVMRPLPATAPVLSNWMPDPAFSWQEARCCRGGGTVRS